MEDLSKLVIFTVLADNMNLQIENFDLTKQDTIVVKVNEEYTAFDMHVLHDVLLEKLNRDKVLIIPKKLDLESYSNSQLIILRNQINELIEGKI